MLTKKDNFYFQIYFGSYAVRIYRIIAKTTKASQCKDKRASPAIDWPGCFCCIEVKGQQKCCPLYHDKFNL